MLSEDVQHEATWQIFLKKTDNSDECDLKTSTAPNAMDHQSIVQAAPVYKSDSSDVGNCFKHHQPVQNEQDNLLHHQKSDFRDQNQLATSNTRGK